MKTLRQIILVITFIFATSICYGETVTGQVTKITDYTGISMQVGDKWINNFPDDSTVKLYDTVTVEYKQVGFSTPPYYQFVKWGEIIEDKPTGEIYPKSNLFADGKKEGNWHVQVDPDCIGVCNADLVVFSEENGKNVFKKYGDEHITGHFDFDGKEIKMYDEKGEVLYGGKLFFKNNAWIMKIFGEKTIWTFEYLDSSRALGKKRVE